MLLVHLNILSLTYHGNLFFKKITAKIEVLVVICYNSVSYLKKVGRFKCQSQ